MKAARHRLRVEPDVVAEDKGGPASTLSECMRPKSCTRAEGESSCTGTHRPMNWGRAWIECVSVPR
eukprot:640789-Prymnesium_polylepis.1